MSSCNIDMLTFFLYKMPMTKQKIEQKPVKQATGIRLDAEIIQELKHLAVDLKRSYTNLVDEAIRDLLQKYKAKK